MYIVVQIKVAYNHLHEDSIWLDIELSVISLWLKKYQKLKIATSV